MAAMVLVGTVLGLALFVAVLAWLLWLVSPGH